MLYNFIGIGRAIFGHLTTETAVISRRMVRVLNVAEKNDASKSISEIMSRGRYRKREGFSKYNKIYEFEFNILNQNCTMTMTSVSGHLLGLEFIGQYKKWHSCNPVALFDVPVEKYCPQDFTDIKRTLEREIRGCQTLIIWTDCDREGENIGMEVVQVCTAVKPNIKVYRAHFSEMTPQAVTRAVQGLTAMDRNVSDAVDVRQELDLRIGAAFTRFQTLRLQKIFPQVLADQLISYGSCQFPTLGFVVERYKQVQAFVPEPFWKIRVLHELDETNVEFSWKRGRLFDHLACRILYEHCIETPTARVLEVKSKSKSKWRPQPLDTVELEKLSSRKLRINAKETMKIAEKLYTQGYISYPRTETNKFASDIDLASLIQQQTQDPNWGGFAQRILEHGPNPRNGSKSDQAHPPIHPTKYSNSLQGNEGKVYEFIVRHFLATCSQDAQGMETTVEIDIAEERFTAQGLMIIARNYLEVYPYDKWNAKVIPVYEKDDKFIPNSIEMNDGETSPPPLLTEADLIALMDKHGIGTDATHAEHIETIKSRMYVGLRPDGRFVPGQLGMGLVEGYDAMGYEMSKPNLRAELEADLKKICDGKKNKDVVLQGQVRKYKDVFIEACRQALKIDEALSKYLGEAQAPDTALDITTSLPVRKCPLCGQDMTLRTKKDGKGFYIGCMGYPTCRNVIWLPDFVLDATVDDQICNLCRPSEVRHIKFKFRRGSVAPMLPSEYTGCIGGCDDILTQTLNIRTPTAHTGTQQSGPRGQANQRTPPDNNSSSSRQTSRSIHSLSSSQANSFLLPSSTNNRIAHNQPVKERSSNYTGKENRMSVPTVSVAPVARNGGSSVDGGDDVMCNCGKGAVLLTVRKEGPNTGRQFFKCGDSGCSFFLWADEAETQPDNNSRNNLRGTLPNQRPQPNQRPSFESRNGFPASNTGNIPQCNCGTPGRRCTVQKEGPNKGRQFYGCHKPRGEGCGFFQWADEDDQSTTSSNDSVRRTDFNQRPASHSWDQNRTSGDVPTCTCGDTAKSLSVMKEGPNKGRAFYACPKPRGEGCNFFQWGDENVQGGNSGPAGGNRTASKKRNASSDSLPAEKRSRKCGLCGEEGHTRRKCPHNS